MQEIKNRIYRTASNLPGWRTSRKIVVIESDDWGSIRMSDNKSLNQLIKAGIVNPDSSEFRYFKFDTIESELDLEALFLTLTEFADQTGRPAVFTPITIMANPDFERIRDAKYNRYYFEPFNKTYENYFGNSNCLKQWENGINNRLFVPQFHGREHLNVHAWMNSLRSANKDTIFAFELGVCGISPRIKENSISFQAAFDIGELQELSYLGQVLEEGLIIFQKIFGYNASFFVPTNGPYNFYLNNLLSRLGIKFISTSKIQRQPIGGGKFKKSYHYLGQRNKFGQMYLTRNCFFEPSSPLHTDWVDHCLYEVNNAFFWKKPAIISTHRVNYVGGLNEENRENGLRKLSLLLKTIKMKWPTVEFMTSEELGNLIAKDKSYN